MLQGSGFSRNRLAIPERGIFAIANVHEGANVSTIDSLLTSILTAKSDGCRSAVARGACLMETEADGDYASSSGGGGATGTNLKSTPNETLIGRGPMECCRMGQTIPFRTRRPYASAGGLLTV